jgi:hypothetical protein
MNPSTEPQLFDVTQFGPANSPVSERVCAARIKSHPTDCEEAQNRLAMGAMGEAVLYVHKVCRGNIPPGEIISLCYKTLIYAARQVDAAKNWNRVFNPARSRFFAYSKPYLRGEVKSWWGQQDVVKGSNTRMETLYHEVAPVSLLEIIYCEDAPPDDRLEQGGQTADDGSVEIAVRELTEALRNVIKEELTAEEQELLRRYYEDEDTLVTVGGNLSGKKLSKEGCRLWRDRILNKLRKAMRRRGFDGRHGNLIP